MTDGRSMPGFDLDRHGNYTDKGYCDAVHWTKAYCAGREGHAGQHWGIYLTEDQSMRVYPLWD